MDRKKTFKSTFRGRKIDRPLFLPFIGTYLTKVSQCTMEEACSDPGALYQSLRDTQKLLNFDVVVLPLDAALEAEAFGCEVTWNSGEVPMIDRRVTVEDIFFDENQWLHSGRIPVFLEAVHRFSKVEGKEVPIVASITGPLTLSDQLFGKYEESKIEEIVQALISLTKAYADAGVDGIIINEEVVPDDVDFESHTDYYKPILNVIRHYNLNSVLRLTHNETTLDDVLQYLNVDGFILQKGQSDKDVRTKTKKAIGICIDCTDSIETKPLEEISQSPVKKLFFTTENPLHQEDIDLDTLQENIEYIQNTNQVI